MRGTKNAWVARDKPGPTSLLHLITDRSFRAARWTVDMEARATTPPSDSDPTILTQVVARKQCRPLFQLELVDPNVGNLRRWFRRWERHSIRMIARTHESHRLTGDCGAYFQLWGHFTRLRWKNPVKRGLRLFVGEWLASQPKTKCRTGLVSLGTTMDSYSDSICLDLTTRR